MLLQITQIRERAHTNTHTPRCARFDRVYTSRACTRTAAIIGKRLCRTLTHTHTGATTPCAIHTRAALAVWRLVQCDLHIGSERACAHQINDFVQYCMLACTRVGKRTGARLSVPFSQLCTEDACVASSLILCLCVCLNFELLGASPPATITNGVQSHVLMEN